MLSGGEPFQRFSLFCKILRKMVSVMAIVAGKTLDFQGIAGFLMGLKPDIVSIHHHREPA